MEAGPGVHPHQGTTAAEGPIVRRPLHEEVAVRLRDLITQGIIPAGARLNEVALCAQLGVSRTPLREAVRILAGEGLVELVPARGALVRRLTLKDVADSLVVLRSLETLAGHLACSEGSDAGIAAVDALHHEMMQRYDIQDRLGYFKLNQSIHTSIVALSGNATLIWAHEAIQSRMKHIRFIGNAGPVKWANAVAEHEEMVRGLKARDGEALASVLGKHLDNTYERVKDMI
ncbi:FCD domain-containing protein [Pseudoroseomonas wenyumeiae]|uniref:FCD domain-containing protein n=1 Tax=Teichococcus wenyumeiae TaxID=2478470 RepID=A0A3A9JFS1_9PROT|nr:GntR family transcriptional regulator [Pseudoroseomonas wenyumeiae]RKK02414.1 GntR family transcriptional regulator [Pseudoroseomonas wenyumeiae]RMI15314.1 FCD domain-containing protein [Pseudoroseomonas wenyumeiae]